MRHYKEGGKKSLHCTRNMIVADHSARTAYAISFVYQAQVSIAYEHQACNSKPCEEFCRVISVNRYVRETVIFSQTFLK